MRFHKLGQLPCGNCNLGQHKNCRPKLDGTLCSCSCPKAELIRSEVERKSQAALNAGQLPPPIEEAVRIIVPRYKQAF